MSGLNVFFSDLHICSQDFSDQVLTVEPTNKMPALICRCLQALARGTEDKRVHYEHQFGIYPHWRRGRQGLVCGGLC